VLVCLIAISNPCILLNLTCIIYLHSEVQDMYLLQFITVKQTYTSSSGVRVVVIITCEDVTLNNSLNVVIIFRASVPSVDDDTTVGTANGDASGSQRRPLTYDQFQQFRRNKELDRQSRFAPSKKAKKEEATSVSQLKFCDVE
jgi:hypothetical protein